MALWCCFVGVLGGWLRGLGGFVICWGAVWGCGLAFVWLCCILLLWLFVELVVFCWCGMLAFVILLLVVLLVVWGGGGVVCFRVAYVWFGLCCFGVLLIWRSDVFDVWGVD